MSDTILFVDDEKAILNTFQRSLRGSGWEVLTAESGQSALDILARRNIDIIISDMRMPNMNGHQLLRKVKELYPATIRLILSGQAEEKEITAAMLDGSSKMYLLKPWDNELLTKVIRQLLDAREMLRNRNLLLLINKMDGLCSPPQIYMKITEMIGADADMHQISAVVEQDPVLAAKVLQMVNSAFFGIKTGSINQAVMYLGLATLKGIVLATNLCGMMPGHGSGAFDRDFVWNHATSTNRLACGLYRQLTGRTIPPIASAAGLLHDIGWVALLHQMPDLYRKVVAAQAEQPESSLDDLERSILGVSHQEVGGYLLDWWGLPQPIIESAMFHHNPFHDSVTDRELVAIVHIASHYSLKLLKPQIRDKADERAFAVFNVSREFCERLIRDIQ